MDGAKILRSFESPNVDVVSCHSFSADLELLALCPNNSEVHIYEGEDFKKKSVLTKHTQRVTGVSWATDKKLVSVSEDRTAFVWVLDESGEYMSQNVELRAKNACLCVAWSPDGTRFAVGMSSMECGICEWNEEQCWWSVKKCSKRQAAVTCIAWHPTQEYLATGSTDTILGVYDVSRSQKKATTITSKEAGSWVNSVAFNEDGSVLAFAPHDSTVRFMGTSEDAPPSKVRWTGLPFLTIAFVGNERLVACGFDNEPVLFQNVNNSWMVVGVVKSGPNADLAGSKRAAFASAQNMFRGGRAGSVVAESKHTNVITACASCGANRFSTSGGDGQVVLWELGA